MTEKLVTLYIKYQRLIVYNIFNSQQHLFLTDTSSADQRPSPPEKEESDLQQTVHGHVLDLITSTSPNSEGVDDIIGLEVTAENLPDTSIPEVQDNNSEHSSSAQIMEKETSESAVTES